MNSIDTASGQAFGAGDSSRVVRAVPGDAEYARPLRYDDWLVDDRESLRHLRLHAMENLADELSRQDRHAEAIQAALAAVRLEPLRETAHAALIGAHLAEGNRSEALRRFSRCGQLLETVLAVEPSDAIRQLIVRVPAHRETGQVR
jgi:DNA-binding SARP family transcriptional activator